MNATAPGILHGSFQERKAFACKNLSALDLVWNVYQNKQTNKKTPNDIPVIDGFNYK